MRLVQGASFGSNAAARIFLARPDLDLAGVIYTCGPIHGAFVAPPDPTMTALILRPDAALPRLDAPMPRRLAVLPPPRPETALHRRNFILNMGAFGDGDDDAAVDARLAALARASGNFCGSGGRGINGKPMDMSRIDEKVPLGQPEIWRIAADDMEHPFHIHGTSLRILRQLGEALDYASGMARFGAWWNRHRCRVGPAMTAVRATTTARPPQRR